MTLPVIVLGAGGHAKVLISALLLNNTTLLGITDVDRHRQGDHLLGVPILGSDGLIEEYDPAVILLVNGLGTVKTSDRRKALFDTLKAKGYTFATVVHPAAVIAVEVLLGEGAQILAGAVIQPGCQIGRNTIVNTSASVDYDCLIGDHVHLAPGVTLSGEVVVAAGAHIGTGATIIQGVHVGAESLVAAGAVVVDDVPGKSTVMGVPARVVRT